MSVAHIVGFLNLQKDIFCSKLKGLQIHVVVIWTTGTLECYSLILIDLKRLTNQGNSLKAAPGGGTFIDFFEHMRVNQIMFCKQWQFCYELSIPCKY